MELLNAYRLEMELYNVRELRKALELKLKELDYAEGVIASSKSERKLYRVFSDLMVGISKDEAIEHIERMRLAYKREIEKLKEREKKLMEELSKVRTLSP